MNFLSLFVLIPLLMMVGLALSKGMKQIRWVAVVGSSIQLLLAVSLVFLYLQERASGNTAEMLFTASSMWYAPLNIHYAVGVDGVSVAMLLLSAIIVFAGVLLRGKYLHCLRIFSLVDSFCQLEYLGSLFLSTFLPCLCSMRSLLSRCIC